MRTGGIKVLVVDDSAVTRMALRDVLLDDQRIAMVETAADGNGALALIAQLDPDVVTLDVEMPGMDGLSTLRRITTRSPRPVIMLSAHTFAGAEKSIRALEWGAVDVVQKPFGQAALQRIAGDLRNKVVAVGEARRKGPGLWRKWSSPAALRSPPTTSAERLRQAPVSRELRSLVVLGASTGGTEALHYILSSLPDDFPAPVVVVQHMPEFFTGAFAQRLNELCPLEVRESEQRDLLRPGRVIIARGNRHLSVRKEGILGYVELSDLPPVNGHRPSVDVLFHSAAKLRNVLTIGVLLTGMGKDGAEGLLAMHRAGALTVAQDEASCVVYGMPKAAVDLGAAAYVADIRSIPGLLVSGLSPSGRKALRQHPGVLVPVTAADSREESERPPSGRHP